MGSSPKPDERDVPTVIGRRSTRLSMIIPVAISGTSADGQSFKENTWTIGFNKQGARLATFHRLSVGDEIVIANPLLGHTARARIIRIGEKRFPEDPYEIGVELLEPRNVWGVKFPPEDWKGAPVGPMAPRLSPQADVARGGRTTALETPAAKAPAPTAPVPTPAERSQQFTLAIEALSQFAKEAEETVSPEAMPLGEAVRAPAAPGAPLAAEPEPRQVRSLESWLATLSDRARTTRVEVDALLERLRDFQKGWQAELERVGSQAQEAAKQALEQSVNEARDGLRREAEASAQKSFEDARHKLDGEINVASETFRQTAAAASARAIEEHLVGIGPRLDGMFASSAWRLKEEFNKKAAELEPELRATTEEIVEKVAQANLARTTEVTEEKVRAALASLDRTLGEAVEKRLDQIQKESARIAAEIQSAGKQAADERANALDKAHQEALTALGASATEAQEKLRATLQPLESELEGKMQEARNRLAESSTSALDGFRNYVEAMLKSLPEEAQSAIRQHQQQAVVEAVAEVKKAAAKLAEADLARTTQATEEKVRAALASLDRRLGEAVEKRLDQIQKEGTRVAAEIQSAGKQAADERADALDKAHQEALTALGASATEAQEKLRATLQPLGSEIEGKIQEARNRLAESSTSALDGFRNYVEGMLKSFPEEAQSAMRQYQQQAAAEALAEVKKAAAEVVRPTGEQLRKQAEDALELFNHQIASAGEKHLEEVRSRLSELHNATADQLNKDAQARQAEQARLEARAKQLAEETNRRVGEMVEATALSLAQTVRKANEDYRNQLQRTLEEALERSTRDLEAGFQKALEGRRAAFLDEIHRQADEAGAQAAAQVRSRVEGAAKEASDQVLKQVGLATFVLKDWGDQATTRLEATFQRSLESFKAQVEATTRAASEEQRKRSSKTTSDLLHRLRQAAEALESGSENPEPNPPEKPKS